MNVKATVLDKSRTSRNISEDGTLRYVAEAAAAADMRGRKINQRKCHGKTWDILVTDS